MNPMLKDLLKRLYDRAPFKQPIFEQMRRVLRLPEPFYRHLLFRGVFTTEVGPGSFRMQHYGYQIENELFWGGLTAGYEGTSLKLWKELCASAQTVIDGGANTGVYSLVA